MNNLKESEDMKDTQIQRHLRPLILSGLAMLVAATAITPGVAKGQSAADIGVSHPPLVTIIFDSSSSMQWVEKGEGFYPTREKSDDDTHLNTWKTGSHLCLAGSRYQRGTSSDKGCLGDMDFPNNMIPKSGSSSETVQPVETIGPCMVWHPIGSSGPICDNRYRRPTSCGDSDTLCQENFAGATSTVDSWIETRLKRIREDEGMRLVDAQTPRHIQVKQILTGDMILEYKEEGESGKTVKAGPGCWFVPRGRGTSNDQVCCDQVDEFGLCTGSYSRGFDSYIDHDDPIPHFQEIYDYQEKNGLLDAMARTAFFSVVMFDSYRSDGVTDGWKYPMNDIIAGSSPYSGRPADKMPHPIGDNGREDGQCGEGGECYNLGLFRFVGPTSFDMTERQRVLLSDYVQDAIRDAGYLQSVDLDDTKRLTGTRLNEDDEEVEINVYEYPLSRQPMANASPFAAVFHDLHQFFLNGQKHEDVVLNSTSGSGQVVNPFEDDQYKACRARHVVMFTDGVPEPEAGTGFGSDSLSPAYGYDRSRYPYLVTEDAIEEMILEVMDEMEADLPPDQSIDPRFIPRVHVLAVSKEQDSEHWDAIIDKIAKMAAAGRTCAQYYLPPEMVPVGSKTGHVDADGRWLDGKCDPKDPAQDDPVCLVPQYFSGKPSDDGGSAPSAAYMYEPQDGSEPFPCEHPALLLTKNDRETMVKAFQMIFNEIASDLVTRTRPSVTNYLDYDDKAGQYRIFSGVKIGGNSHWKGLLNRQLLECNLDDLSNPIKVSEMRPLHEDINDLRLELAEITDDEYAVDRGSSDRMDRDVKRDRRRIFTSFPAYLRGSLNTKLENASTAEEFFTFTYALHGASTVADEFKSKLDLPGYGSKPSSGDTRVPFTVDGFKGAFKAMDLKDGDLYRYLSLRSSEEDDVEEVLEETVDRYRGRLAELSDRMFGGIYNSNPVTIGPPDMDLPIESYREYRRIYFERPAMTYVGTVDGLLHAIYAGEPEVVVRDLAGNDAKAGPARLQREAWAYIPQLFHQQMVSRAKGAHQILDGSPVVTDIRLCNGLAEANSNPRACPANTGEEGGRIPRSAQWRTVLVQGLGTGPGYFALDVTRAGDRTTPPDPLVLWEFGPQWEEMQVQEFAGTQTWRIAPETDGGYLDSLSDQCIDETAKASAECMPLAEDCDQVGAKPLAAAWQQSYLGVSVAEPAIGTVPMKVSSDDKKPLMQRSVAIFGGGSDIGVEARMKSCTRDITGRAIYVVDLQSGEIIRRFIHYNDGSTPSRFEHPVTGTPVMSAATPGESSTRAFIGDDRGRLFRLDMTSPEPQEWSVDLFFDPAGEEFTDFIPDLKDYEGGKYEQFGAASYPPAVTTNRSRNLVIAYGLGQRDDSGDEKALQAIIALEEVRVPVKEGQKSGDAAPLWRMFFEEGEWLTGAPVAFDNDFFFTTYVENSDHACSAGDARIYRLNHQPIEIEPGGDQTQRWEPTGAWEKSSLEKDAAYFKYDSGDTPRWFGPREPTMIRGLTITMGPTCEDVVEDGEGAATEGPAQKPQLIAQAGKADVGEQGGSGVGGGSDSAGVDAGISRIAMELSTPKTRALPMNWMVIGN